MPVAKCPYKALQSFVQSTGQDTNYRAHTINSQMSSLLVRDECPKMVIRNREIGLLTGYLIFGIVLLLGWPIRQS